MMAHSVLPPLGPAGERGGVGMFWGKSTAGDGLNLYLAPHEEDIQKKAKRAMRPIDNFLDNEAKGPGPGMDLNAAKIDPATGQLVRATMPTLKQLLNSSNVVKQSRTVDNDDPDSMIKSSSAADTISAALTAPTNPSQNYYNVLRALVAAVRNELVPLTVNTVFQLPAAEDLGPAFPDFVVAEDPAYFEARSKARRQLAFDKGAHMNALRKAYMAIGDDLVYCFDRRPVSHSVPPARAKERGAGPTGKGGNGKGLEEGSTLTAHPSVADAPPSITGSMSHSIRSLAKSGLPPDLDEPLNRQGASRLILNSQGRKQPGQAVYASVRLATGDDAAGTSAGPRVGFPRPGGRSDPPLPADVMTDTLRWAGQAAVAAEHRSARCEHVLHMLSTEMAKEAGRQTRLRVGAAKFAASESRRADPAGDWASYLQGVDSSKDKDKAKVGKSKEGAKAGPGSLRYPGARGAASVGSTSFKASDLAWERFDVAQDRAEAADAIMRILEDYRLVPLSVAAGYLRATLAEVDALYGELVGARAKEGGVDLSQQQIEEHVADMNARTGAEEEGRLDGGSLAGAGVLQGKGGLSRLGRSHARAGVIMPASSSSTFVREGGAVPVGQLDDAQEVAQFGPSTSGVRRKAAAKLLAETRRAKLAEEAEFGPGRDATGGEGGGGGKKGMELDTDADPTLISGLSAFNIRPFNARSAARAAMESTVPDPELDTGYVGWGAELKGRKAASPSKNRRNSRQSDGGDDDGGVDLYADGSASGNEGGVDLDAAHNPITQTATGDARGLTRAEKGTGMLKVPTYKGRAGLPGYMHMGRAGGRRASSVGAGAAEAVYRTPAEVAAEAVFGKAAMDSKGFREVALQLTEWNPLGSRPSWQKQMLHSYDLSQLRESTGLKFDQIKRTPKEPPDGRYSHLLGRYMKADDMKAQMAAANRARFGPKGRGVGSAGEGGGGAQ